MFLAKYRQSGGESVHRCSHRVRQRGLTCAIEALERRHLLSAAVYLDPIAPGPTHDGSSWADAYTTLKAALAAASGGQTIEVAQGTYSTGASASFTLVNGVAIDGGYAGYGAADPDARDVNSYPTILTGAGTTGIVLTASGGISATVDGLTLIGSNYSGGGQAFSGNSATVTFNDCTISDFAENAIQMSTGTLIVSNCSFLGNSSNVGIDFSGTVLSSAGSLTLSGCTFTDDTGTDIHLGAASSIVSDCQYNGDNGVAVYAAAGSNTIENCVFNAETSCGAFLNGGSTILENCAFNDCQSSGMVIESATGTLIDCAFDGNTGGSGGGLFVEEYGNATLINCDFVGDSAGEGGGIYSIVSSVSLTNCTFSANTATDAGSGAAIANFGGTATLCNCVAWDAAAAGGAEFGNFNLGPSLNLPQGATGITTVTFSDVQGGYPGFGNINANPFFAAANSPQLQAGSPCINSGSNASIMATGQSTDLAGNPRIVGGEVDMGAFEYQGATPIEPNLVFAVQPTTVIAGTSDHPAIVVDITDQNGNIVTTDQSLVSLAIFTGPSGGALTGTDTVQAVNGVAMFNNVVLDIVGVYVLTANDSGHVQATADSFAVSPAGGGQLVVIGAPEFGVVGQANPQGITVDVDDQFGNLATGDDSMVTVSIASGPSGAVLGGTTMVQASAGVARFNDLIFYTPGTYTLTATDGSFTPSTSSSFAIGGLLVFAQQPSNALAGAAINPAVVVDVVDGYGNIVTSDQSQVTLSAPSIGGDYTVSTVNGVATFNEVFINSAGRYSFNASDGIDRSANSSSFTIRTITPPEGTVDYVDASATGLNNGTSWANAFTTLSAALDNLAYGMNVEVAAGTYSPGVGTASVFTLNTDGVFLLGGYAPGGSDQANPSEYPTVLSGGGVNQYLLTTLNLTSGSEVQGFTITGATQVDMDNSTSDLGIFDCTFSGTGDVGMANTNSSPVITNCTFSGNTYGMNNTNSSPTLSGCTFNSSSISAMMNSSSSMPTLTNCAFNTNSSTENGGAIYDATPSSTMLVNCSFRENYSAIEGGAIFAQSRCNLELINCLFSGNSACDGGAAIYGSGATINVINCTFSDNTDTYISNGGTIQSSGLLDIANTILWGDNVDGPEIAGGGTIQVSYSDVQGGYSGAKNIDADPMFVDPSGGNFQLQSGSPCIDAGNNASVPAGVTTDLSGNSRIVGIAVDIGAYEYQGFSITGVTWTGNAGDLEWSDPANWSDDQVPNQSTSVTIPDNAYAELSSGTYAVAGLTILGTGTVDLTGATLFIDYGSNTDPISSIVTDLTSGYDGGTWLGSGIISSSVAIQNFEQSKLIYSVGYADGADGIVAGLSSGQIELMPTLAGDARLQGTVNFGDFQILARNFGSSGSWDQGDFTYGGSVSFPDFQMLQTNFGSNPKAISAGQSSGMMSELDPTDVLTGGANDTIADSAAGAVLRSD